jgi:DNA-binding response OmpR family regulator
MFNILTVDDDIMICDVLTDFLKGKGYNVRTAHSGEEALESIAKEKPDIVLLDIVMPGMGGEATLKVIKERYIDLPVIMVTVMTDEKKALNLLTEGATDYITKPIDFKYIEKNLASRYFLFLGILVL